MAYVLSNADFGNADFVAEQEAPKVVGTSFLARFFHALAESRMRAAEREIARYRPFLSETAVVMKDVDAQALPFAE